MLLSLYLLWSVTTTDPGIIPRKETPEWESQNALKNDKPTAATAVDVTSIAVDPILDLQGRNA